MTEARTTEIMTNEQDLIFTHEVTKAFRANPPEPASLISLKKGDLLKLTCYDLFSSEFETETGEIVLIPRHVGKSSTEDYEVYNGGYQNIKERDYKFMMIIA